MGTDTIFEGTLVPRRPRGPELLRRKTIKIGTASIIYIPETLFYVPALKIGTQFFQEPS